MKQSLKIGICFGITSGIITTIGLMVGLNSGTHSKLAVVGGILTIAVADAFSDALGIHISEESDSSKTKRHVWESTITTFLAKFFTALTFVVPVIFFDLSVAVISCVVWGLLVISVLSYFVACAQGEKPWSAVFEHFITAAVVVTIAHYVGVFISKVFV